MSMLAHIYIHDDSGVDDCSDPTQLIKACRSMRASHSHRGTVVRTNDGNTIYIMGHHLGLVIIRILMMRARNTLAVNQCRFRRSG